MNIFLALVLSAAQASVQPPKFNPTTVVAGELTKIQLTLQEEHRCVNLQHNALRIRINATEGVLIFTDSDEALDLVHQNRDLGKGTTVRTIDMITGSKSASNYKDSFSYFDLNPTTSNSHLYVAIDCVSVDGRKITSSEVLLPTQRINIAVTAPPAFPEVVKLTPSETTSTSISSISLSAPWPIQCRKEKNPTVRLSLDAETVKAGNVLSSDTNSAYTIQGFKGTAGEEIKSNETKKDGFHSLEFKRLYYDLYNQLHLNFKFHAQEVPVATSKDTPIEVKFICGSTEVKAYSKENGNAPSVKVNHATHIPFTLPALLLSIIAIIG
ncbi:hypothetical protein DSO57_1007900 [Entomophthora muscae]|uniref:Uncharacterized protein n=1 Tax=Entomophthora muscae TaxID=34485 RepID=A0ACC2T7A0_9FUNG|nr:hypothetical protein DSO57_1007900 [Entomophthora muscae]